MHRPLLDRELTYIKGIGPHRSKLLKEELSLVTVRDLLLEYPMRYEDRTSFQRISDIRGSADVVQLRGYFTSFGETGSGRKKRLVGRFTDQSGTIELVWFRSIKWLKENLNIHQPYVIYGRVNKFGRRLSMAHPEIENFSKKQTSQTFIPVYRSTEKLGASGLDSKGRRKIVKYILSQLSERDTPEHLPHYLISKLHFPTYYHALQHIHFPTNNQELHDAERRLKFEELFLMQLTIVKHYIRHKTMVSGYVFPEIGDYFNNFYREALPFDLTGAQKKVLKEIRKDLKSGQQMNRLLQGDVGSGKTIVALMTMLIAIDNGFQTCLMAPTEILAQQHFESIKDLVKDIKVRVGILTGSVKGKARKELLKLVRLGEIPILVGTHALIEEGVTFNHLGLAIIDEQHRFGVAQRAKLWEKGRSHPPHILVMTATPIPRTLHMTLYGDIDISIIDELPPGRKPIRTQHKTEYNRPDVYKFVKKEIARGHQVYIVYPLIEESETLDLENLNSGYERLLVDFPPPDYQISVVHGRMNQEQKDFEMQRFVEGKTHIMVATTVIEVGVNVPNASVMIIENAERFGLSQLHQLRGRVGRGADQSFCILMTSFKITHEARERLNTIVSTNDGFVIAEADLKIRGPGNMSGTEQSGVPMLKFANLIKDNALLKTAREIAMRILEKDPDLRSSHHQALRQYLEKYVDEVQDWSQIS